MTGDRLLRLYPRAWRERYGDEFLAMVGDEPLSLRHTVDIVAGAIDARLSRTVPAATRASTSTSTEGGHAVITALKTRLCEKDANFTIRDSLLGAAVVLGISIAAVLFDRALSNAGYEAAGQALIMFSAPGALLVSMPFWLIKGQPVRAQVVVVGVPLLILAALAVLTAMK